MNSKIIIVSGYFNPILKGHIELFHKAKSICDKLFVIVDKVFLSEDQDRTVRLTIEKIYSEFANSNQLYFANGGDQNNNSIPEANTCKNLGIQLIEGMGAKVQSSSWLLNKLR